MTGSLLSPPISVLTSSPPCTCYFLLTSISSCFIHSVRQCSAQRLAYALLYSHTQSMNTFVDLSFIGYTSLPACNTVHYNNMWYIFLSCAALEPGRTDCAFVEGDEEKSLINWQVNICKCHKTKTECDEIILYLIQIITSLA